MSEDEKKPEGQDVHPSEQPTNPGVEAPKSDEAQPSEEKKEEESKPEKAEESQDQQG